jgi:acetoacetyl-CoA synthetase
MAEELWRHPHPASTPMWRFLQYVNEKHGLQLDDYAGLYKWSVDQVGPFWESCWEFVGIQADVNGKVR